MSTSMPCATWRSELQSIGAVLHAPHEASILIEEVAGRRMAELTLVLDEPLSRGQQDNLAALVARRLGGQPLQHIVGHWPFRNVELLVDARALIPRPETEQVVEVALRELATLRSEAALHRENFVPLVVDLGTGTGAISCAIVDEVVDAQVIAIDRSGEALELARQNVDRLSGAAAGRVTVLAGSWFAPLQGREHSVDLIIANPPYLSEREWHELDPVVRDYDPRGALVAGESGLEDLAQIIDQAPVFLRERGVLVCEIGATQGAQVRALGRRAGADAVLVEPDLAGRDRTFVARFSR